MLLSLALVVVSSGLAPTTVEGAAPGLAATTLGVGGGSCGRQPDEKGTAEAVPGNSY